MGKLYPSIVDEVPAMVSKVINISLPEELLREIDEAAAFEHRTRSELMRESVRSYIESRRRWREIQTIGAERARALGLRTEDDVEDLLDSLPD
jgi:metal-responsive CopG/Arc/MetJ family transcriptional regulator